MNNLYTSIKNVESGRLAQLVERLPYKERVRSSSLLTPTISKKSRKGSFLFFLIHISSTKFKQFPIFIKL